MKGAGACYDVSLSEVMWRRMSEVLKSRLATAAVLSLALSPIAPGAEERRAQSAPSLVETELCTEKLTLPGFAPAALATRLAPEFPDADATDENEGWVRLGFTIDAEGETKDIVVLDRVGSRNMVKAARLAVARWKYKPATQDGQAVEQYGASAEILFRDQHTGNTAIHDAVVAKFDEGRILIADTRYAQGIAVLEQTFELPLTLFERARVSFALAYAYEKTNDMPRALGHIRHALIERGNFLEKAMLPAAQRLRLRAEVANGNFHYAACAPPLPAGDKFDPTGADRKETTEILDNVMKKLASATPLAVDATVTADAAGGEGGVWEHPVSRRKFKFAEFTAPVQEFRLSCVRQSTQSPMNEATQWSVPRSAGPCILRVYGPVGATFRLIEEW